MSEWNKERVTAIVTQNKAVAMQALMELYKRQSEAEKAIGATVGDNGVGFTKFDAELLTSFAQQLEHKGYLSAKQMIVLRNRLPKYWRQLAGMLSPLAEQEIQQREQAQLFEGSW